MSRFRSRTLSFGVGRNLLRYVALIGFAGLAVASSQAEGQDCVGEARPSFISQSEFRYPSYALASSGRYAYVVEDLPFDPWVGPREFRFDVFDILHSARRASISIDDSPCIEVDGGFAYLGGPEFRVLDVSDPAATQIVGTYPTPQYIWSIAVRQPYACLADAAGLSVLDVSDPTSPTSVGSLAIPEPALSVVVNGSYAYLAAGAAGLAVVDISDPASPSLVGTCVLP